MAISSNDIEGVLKGIWSNVLGQELNLAGGPSAGPAESGGLDPAHMSSCVQITGDWQGAVMIDCAGVVARKIAAAMFAMEAGAVSKDEVRDALGEIANMAGGNLKPLLPGRCQLSLPTVAEGGDFKQMVPGSEVLFRVGFNSIDGDLAVSVLHKAA